MHLKPKAREAKKLHPLFLHFKTEREKSKEIRPGEIKAYKKLCWHIKLKARKAKGGVYIQK